MVEQSAERQYDDDLTVGVDDDYEDFVQTDDVDLFEFFGEEESSISKLKTIVLSIDWEITDENLNDFMEELQILKEEQVDDKINLVYIQALEKLSKYIFKEKSNANHNALKLFQSFFYTLEKNISSEDLTEDDRKKVLAEDIKKFEKLKVQIESKKIVETKKDIDDVDDDVLAGAEPVPFESNFAGTSPIMNLKAIILGMDWEITDKELNGLGVEVRRLEEQFKNSKPKLIFLQGIGVLGAYIKKKKSNAHADAFKLLHSFCANLEKVATTSYTYEEEKAILLPEVEKFNQFKKLVAGTISADEMDAPAEGYDDQYEPVTPAFSDISDDIVGFQVDEEAARLHTDDKEVSDKIESFFQEDSDRVENSLAPQGDNEDVASHVDSFFDKEEPVVINADTDAILQGVDVETDADDDSDEDPLPYSSDGEIAPALAGDDEVASEATADEDNWQHSAEANEVFAKIDNFFGVDEQRKTTTDEDLQEAALKGVDVETDDDDDSNEEPLPLNDSGEFEPALSMDDDEVSINKEINKIAERSGDSGKASTKSSELPPQVSQQTQEESFAEEVMDDDVFEEPSEDDSFVFEEETAGGDESDQDYLGADTLGEDYEDDLFEQDSAMFSAESEERFAEAESSSLASGDDLESYQAFDEQVEDDDLDIEEDNLDEEVVAFELVEDDLASDDFADDTELSEIHSGLVDRQTDHELDAFEGDDEYSAVFNQVVEQKSAMLAISQDELARLRESVLAVNEHVDSEGTAALQSVIQDLIDKSDDHPTGKTFLQLMYTVAENIEKCRYDQNSDAYNTLQSVFEKFEVVAGGHISQLQAQELLLTESSKVLQWQQTIINRQAANGDHAAYTDKVVSNELKRQEDFQYVFTEKDVVDDSANSDTEMKILRKDIQSLKESFKEEIEALRTELKNK